MNRVIEFWQQTGYGTVMGQHQNMGLKRCAGTEDSFQGGALRIPAEQRQTFAVSDKPENK